ncbi:MAG: hypothetical protein WBS24_04145 [Terriglobales bacterium]
MTRSWTQPAVLISALLLAAMLAVAAYAVPPSQTASGESTADEPSSGAASSGAASSRERPASAFDPANEVTVTGTVERFEAHSETGPMGLHLLISASGSMVDAHLGRYFSKENQAALPAGTPVQIVGVNEGVRGKQVLLARQLIFGGRLVMVRNERGFIIHPHRVHAGVNNSSLTNSNREQGTVRDNKSAVNGGAQ